MIHKNVYRITNSRLIFIWTKIYSIGTCF